MYEYVILSNGIVTIAECAKRQRRPRRLKRGLGQQIIASSLKSLRSLKSLMSHVIAKSPTLTVMLSVAKYPLAGNTLCALSLVGFEEILHFVQNDNAWCRHCEEMLRLRSA